MLGHRLDSVHRRGRDAAGIALARPALEWLRDAAGGPVYLARLVDGEIVIVEIVDGPKTPRIDLCVGVHDAAHATALGKGSQINYSCRFGCVVLSAGVPVTV